MFDKFVSVIAEEMSVNKRSVALKNSLLKQLYFEKSLSCADLSERMEKSIPLVSKTVNELIREDLVMEQGYAPSSGGRRPLLYSLRPDGMFILSVAMDQLSTSMVIVDMMNKPVSSIETFEVALVNNPDALPELVRRIQAFLDASGVKKEKIIGAGIGMPGFVDPEKGVNYTFLDMRGGNLRKYISDALKLPVYIDNDSSLVALAELRFGAAKSMQNAMVVNVGWGVGLGMIVNGGIFRGHTGFAGEFSHIPISENGALCTCGKRGCLETECSLLVVARRAMKEIADGRVSSLQNVIGDQPRQVAEAVMEAAVKGDQYAVELFSDAGYVIGKGLAILIHIMNPEIIVLSGKGASVGNVLLASAQQALHKYAIPRLAEATTLRTSELGEKAGLIGAAALVIENFVTNTN